jgi:hypothetical protein
MLVDFDGICLICIDFFVSLILDSSNINIYSTGIQEIDKTAIETAFENVKIMISPMH